MPDDIRPVVDKAQTNTSQNKITPTLPAQSAQEAQQPQSVDSQHLLSTPKKGWKRLARWYHFLSKRQKIVLWSILAGLLISSVLIWALFIRAEEEPPPPPVPVVKEAPPPKPTTELTCITGEEVPIGKRSPQTTGIMVENSPAARPQSGLYQAEVVYEAIAEGGITRFLAIFEQNRPATVGPVRSLRPYYIDFFAPYDAGIAHAGGSGQALAEISNFGYKDIEAFQNPGYFRRSSSRAAPHNLYTSRKDLYFLQKDKGWKTKKCEGFDRRQKENPSDLISAKTINLNISSANYSVRWKYDKNSNSYLRYMAGIAHIDGTINKQIRRKVVVILVMKHHYAGIYSVYKVNASGRAYIFQNGKLLQGKWSKKSRRKQFIFKDNKGKAIKLNPGNTWVNIIRDKSELSVVAAPKPKPRPSNTSQ